LRRRWRKGPTRAYAAHKALLRAWAVGGVAAADDAMFDIAMPLFETGDVQRGLKSAVDALKAGKPRPVLDFKGTEHDAIQWSPPRSSEEGTMDRIAAMTAFVRVVEAGTFTKAADTLDLPNASVTRLIQGLEQELKVRLLHRTTRSVTVTPEGATYYERVVRLLADLADIESSTRLSQGKPSGKVRVEAAAAIGTMVIVPALAEFYRDYPEVDVELGVGNRRADLVAEGVDCAIRAGEISEQMIVARRIGAFQFTTCATPAFLQRHGTPTTLEEAGASVPPSG
jgi:hypothetical protein